MKGRLCEISTDPCANNPCQNNALCLSTSTGHKCLCPSPVYTGLLCEINQSPCQYSPCQNGICQPLGNTSSFSCNCYPGYTGQFCHLKINYCLSQPCENNGVCANIATGFVCTCLPGFTGPTCSVLEKSYSNNASNLDHNRTVQCPQGFTNPPHCTEDINECLLEKDLCKNGGECINTVGSYLCKCNEYYHGNDCNTPFDLCVTNPCLPSNSISCTSTITNMSSLNYNCTCHVGFTGKIKKISLNLL